MNDRKRGRPKKRTLAAAMAAAASSTAGHQATVELLDALRNNRLSLTEQDIQICQQWTAAYEAAGSRGRPDKLARGDATRAVARRLGISDRRVEQIRKEVTTANREIQAWVQRDRDPMIEQNSKAIDIATEAKAAITSYAAAQGTSSEIPAVLQITRHTSSSRRELVPYALASIFLEAHKGRLAAERRAIAAERQAKSLQTQLAAYKASYG